MTAAAPLVAVAVAGCRHLPDPRCEAGMTREQCLFYVATLDEHEGNSGGNGGASGDGRLDPELVGTWDQIDDILEEAARMLSQGLGAELTADALTPRCDSAPRPQDTETGRAWACFLLEAPVLEEHELSLEIGEAGTAGLTGFDFTLDQSQAVLDTARSHWRSWCATSRFEELDTDNDKDVYRCALPGGSQLVVGRFLQDTADLGPDLWQVTLAVMGPG